VPYFAIAEQSSGTIAQSFDVDAGKGEITAGALVSLKAGSSRTIELATAGSNAQLAGVVDKTPLVSITSTHQGAQVVLSGTSNVLVSDINGAIAAGDKIAASPIAGVGMVATADSQIAGTAGDGLDISKTQARSITDSHGKEHTIHIGLIPLQVGVAYYQAPGSSFLPPFIQRLANNIAGRTVSLIRILVCSTLLLLSVIIVVVLISTTVRSAMISLGRNPLAASAIRKGVYQVIGITAVILGGSLLAAYLILTV